MSDMGLGCVKTPKSKAEVLRLPRGVRFSLSLNSGPQRGEPHASKTVTDLRTTVGRHLRWNGLLPENHVVRRKRDSGLRVLGPHVATWLEPTRIVQSSGFEVQVWEVAAIVKPLMIDARPALRAKVATHASIGASADKVGRLHPSDVNLGILKNDGHAKCTCGLLLTNRAVARVDESGAPQDFVPNRTALASALIVSPHPLIPSLPKTLQQVSAVSSDIRAMTCHHRLVSKG